MRIPRNRRSGRFKRKYTREEYIRSANIIQKAFQKFLKNRYSGTCKNFDDNDIFTMEPVHLIPKELFICVEDQGFNVCHLLLWIIRSKTQVHPMTRNTLQPSTSIQCVEQIARFLARDSKKFRGKK
ncbi:unnamed protein product [Laminaria digitata]